MGLADLEAAVEAWAVVFDEVDHAAGAVHWWVCFIERCCEAYVEERVKIASMMKVDIFEM